MITKAANIVWLRETIQRCHTIRSVVGRSGHDYLRKSKDEIYTTTFLRDD